VDFDDSYYLTRIELIHPLSQESCRRNNRTLDGSACIVSQFILHVYPLQYQRDTSVVNYHCNIFISCLHDETVVWSSAECSLLILVVGIDVTMLF